MHQEAGLPLTEELMQAEFLLSWRHSPGTHPDSNAQGCLTLGFTQIRQEWAQAMVTVTLKAVTSPHLTGPRL